MSSSLALSALNTAIARRKINGQDVASCIVHSDRGSRLRSATYCQALKDHGLRGSMGRIAAAGDNCDGIILPTTATQRVEGENMGHTRRTDHRGDLVDRAPLPPAAQTKQAWSPHTDRV